MMTSTAYFWPLVTAARSVLDADDRYRTVAHRLGEEERLRALMEVTTTKREIRALLDRIEGPCRFRHGAEQRTTNNGVN